MKVAGFAIFGQSCSRKQHFDRPYRVAFPELARHAEFCEINSDKVADLLSPYANKKFAAERYHMQSDLAEPNIEKEKR